MYPLETEHHPSIAGHVNHPIPGTIAFQRMGPEPGKIHVRGGRRFIETGHNTFDLGGVLRRQAPPFSCLVERLETFMPEAKDHAWKSNVSLPS